MIESYEIKKLPCDELVVKYGFEDVDGNEYLVQLKNDAMGPGSLNLGSSYELTYFVWDADIKDWSIDKIVNSNIFRLTKTVFGEVVSDFLRSRNWIKSIRFEGLAKETEKKFAKTKRTKIYVRYLTNNPIEGYRLEGDSNRINLVKIVK
jgi:hypothetical protein